MAAWKEGRKEKARRKKGNEEGRAGEAFLSRASGSPSSWVEWVALGMRGLVACTSGGEGWPRGTLPGVAPSHPWLWGHFTWCSRPVFSVCRRGMAYGSLLGWIVGANAAACWQCPSLSPGGQERARAPGVRRLREQRGVSRWVSWPLPGLQVPVGEAFPAGEAAEVREQGPWVERCPGRGAPCLRGPAALSWGRVGPPHLRTRAGRGSGWEGGQHGLITETLFPQLSETCPRGLQLGSSVGGLLSLPNSGCPGAGASQPGVGRGGPGPCPRPPGIPGARFKALLPSQLFCDVLSVF